MGRTTAGKDESPVGEAVGEEPGGRRVEIYMQEGRNSILPGVFADGRGETTRTSRVRRPGNEGTVEEAKEGGVGGHHYDGRRAPLRRSAGTITTGDMVSEGGGELCMLNYNVRLYASDVCTY